MNHGTTITTAELEALRWTLPIELEMDSRRARARARVRDDASSRAAAEA